MLLPNKHFALDLQHHFREGLGSELPPWLLSDTAILVCFPWRQRDNFPIAGQESAGAQRRHRAGYKRTWRVFRDSSSVFAIISNSGSQST